MKNFIISIVLVIFLIVVDLFSGYHQIMNISSAKPSSSLFNRNIQGGKEIITIGEFPYRKYDLEPYVKDILKILLDTKILIKDEKWNIPENKVKSRLPVKIYYEIEKVVSTPLKNHWQYDRIVDYYCEKARIKTPGYGEQYSLYEYWYNTELHNRWISNNIRNHSKNSLRELLYKKIQEARPAYISVSKSLYTILGSMYKEEKKISVLDIAAYGERAIAAIGLNYKYTGIDPNYDLIEGHDKIIMDLKTFNSQYDISFYHVGLEDFKSNEKYDIITYSPPPFNTEPYGPGQKTQSYAKYPTFDEYLCCFLTELIYKAKKFSNIGTVFSFTALDRNPTDFPIHIDKKYISDNLELIYVEALLLITSCFGFNYFGAIGYSVGDKPAQVPWWTYIYNNEVDIKSITLLREFYPEVYNNIGLRILFNLNKVDHELFNYHKVVHKNINFEISTFVNNKNIDDNKLLLLEIIRNYIQRYVTFSVQQKCNNLTINKIKNVLGKYLTLRSITATFNEPWKSCLYLDYVFPTKCDFVNIEFIENYIIDYLTENGVENAKEIIQTEVYYFKSYECIGISDLYNTIANYIVTIPLSMSKITIKSDMITGNVYTINLLKEIPGFVPNDNIIWHKKDFIHDIRYETLGILGHHYTRPEGRTEILNDAFGEKVMDIYASFHNNQSKYYCSIYPDVEPDSVGSAFTIKLIKGAYLANPVDIPIFLDVAVNNIIKDLRYARENNEKLIISMGFTLWLDKNQNFLDDFHNISYKKLFINTDNKGLQIISMYDFVTYIYILNSKKFPSVSANKKTVTGRSTTISVGVVLSTTNEIKFTNLQELAQDGYFRIINT